VVFSSAVRDSASFDLDLRLTDQGMGLFECLPEIAPVLFPCEPDLTIILETLLILGETASHNEPSTWWRY